MGKIILENMHFYARHGVLDEEQKIGGEYIVSVEIDTDLEEAALSDDLKKTIDYGEVYELIKKEMEISSRLIEHIGKRISNALKNRFPSIEHLQIKLSKINPPFKGHIDRVTIVISD